MDRIYYIECAKCGESFKEPVPNELPIFEAEQEIKKMVCRNCGCADEEELERMVITLPKEKKYGSNFRFRPSHR